ncbi:hypothetical protein ACOQFV_24590 [Nocardiopsis changdeensis]|uniref:MarR family transcriptional regulator n=1 Tax=Nocardiopsis changdeensis TaxID=2831969 RepID=A0A975KS15_9ACTN|nr:MULTISPECIES: hypothetical protein [Nocardiopsis]QUX26430.1 hypothetical protein KGD84_32550 [Nocardiopsis changdeensis]QYX40702.1 hypothetical protein K1J57_32400 [Nocardiopsis sp. MT53]
MWDELVRWIAPRRNVRIDPDRSHDYGKSSPVDAGEPECPYALHLTDADHRFLFVVFDLDVSRHPDGAAAVWRDADTVTGLLDEVGLGHMVVRSGPAGGIHVWVPVSAEEGMDPDEVARLGRAAARCLPTLDVGPLTERGTGAVRPPGSPHRAGGRAELLYPADPADALMVCDTATNTAERFEALAVAFGAREMDAEEEAEAVKREGRIDTAAMRLRGRRRPMPAKVRALLDADPGADPSAHLARLLPGLALARWSLEDVRALVAAEPAAPGLEHLRTRRFGTGRVPRNEDDRRARLVRKWRHALDFAARLAPVAARVESVERDLLGLRATGAAVLEAVADPGRWTEEAGPADQMTLLGVLHVALKACAPDGEVDVDVRRLALATGFGKSTVARALHRLRRDGRLIQAAQAEGTRSARWRLVHPTRWKDNSPGETGGTQVNHAPATDTSQQTPPPSRGELLEHIQARLELSAHEVWSGHSPTHAPGLGHHVEQTYAALVEHQAHLYDIDPATVSPLTGYSTARTARHLRILAHHGLIDPHTGMPTDTAALDTAAARLGTLGVRAARERRYAAERAAHAAWLEEVARLRSPVALRPRTRPKDRYARRDGQPAHGLQIARHLAAA